MAVGAAQATLNEHAAHLSQMKLRLCVGSVTLVATLAGLPQEQLATVVCVESGANIICWDT